MPKKESAMVPHLEDPLKAPAMVEVDGAFDPGAEVFADLPEAPMMEAVAKGTRRNSAFGRFAVGCLACCSPWCWRFRRGGL